MLDCNEATRLISIRNFKKTGFKDRIRLSLHLMACKFCNQFSKFNDIIDESMPHVCNNSGLEGKILSNSRKLELEKIFEKEENK